MKEKWDLTHKWKDNINKWKEAEKKWKGSKNKTNKSNSEANIFPPRQVIITVTNIETGWAKVKPHPFDNDQRFKVPLYQCMVEGTNDNGDVIVKYYNVIRFGIQLDPDKGITTPKVVGLKDEQSYTLTLIGYLGMSWQIKGGWYIHEGSPNPQEQAWGAIGCIEVTGKDQWDDFNNTILELSGVTSFKDASDKKLVKVEIEAIEARPTLIEIN